MDPMRLSVAHGPAWGALPHRSTQPTQQPHSTQHQGNKYGNTGEATGLMTHPESLVDSAYGSTMKAATGKAVPADWRLVTRGCGGGVPALGRSSELSDPSAQCLRPALSRG